MGLAIAQRLVKVTSSITSGMIAPLMTAGNGNKFKEHLPCSLLSIKIIIIDNHIIFKVSLKLQVFHGLKIVRNVKRMVPPLKRAVL